MTVRTLTFASLLLGAVQPMVARAEEPTYQQGPVVQPLTLAAKWALSVKNGVLIADLTLVNTGTSAVDVLIKSGHSPGPAVSATLTELALEPVLDRAQEQDMMSRMGPMPTFGVIAAGRELKAGTYKFTLPKGYEGQTVRISAYVRGEQGEPMVLPLTLVLPKQGAV